MTHLLISQAAISANSNILLWAFVLLGIAIFLLFLELFLPSGGMLAIVGAASVVGSLVCFFLHSTSTGLVALGIGVVFGPACIWLVFRWWLDSPLGRRMILGGDQLHLDQSEEEAHAASAHAMKERASYHSELVGMTGVAETPLRPIGIIRIDGQRLEALSEHGIIESGTKVTVMEARDNQLKVRSLDT